MTSKIKHIINFYLYSSLHIGLCAVFLYLFNVERFVLTYDRDYMLFLLSSTVFTYSIHRIIGMKKVESFADKGRFAVISNYRKHIIFYAILGAAGSAYSFLTFESDRQVLLIGAGIISILYTLPVFGKSMRLRDFSYIKIFLIAIIWSYVAVFLPMYESGNDSLYSSIFFIEIVLFFLAITIPFDIRDLEVDKSNNVNTIPTALGKKKSIQLSILLLMLCFVFEVGLLSFGNKWGLFVPIESSIAMITTLVITIYLIWKTIDKKNDYYYSGLIDGMIMLPYILLVIF